MVKSTANEPEEANEALEFDSSDPFEVLRNADRFEESERESERQLKGDEPEETQEEPAAPAQAAPVAAAPKTYKFAGKEYTPEEIVKEYADPEKIMDLLTAREQYKHLNKKHAEMMEDYKQSKLKEDVVEAVKQAIPRQTPDVPANPQEIVSQARQSLQPIVQSWVKNGIIDQETAEAVPDIVSMIAYQQLEYNRKVAEIDKIYREQLLPVLDYANNVRQVGHQQSVVSALDNTINRVTSRGGVFGGLGDENTKAQFVQYLAELNPEVDILFSEKADDFIAKQFIAFNGDQLLSMYSQPAGDARVRNVGRASGEGTSPRPGRTTEPNTDIKRVLFARG